MEANLLAISSRKRLSVPETVLETTSSTPLAILRARMCLCAWCGARAFKLRDGGWVSALLRTAL